MSSTPSLAEESALPVGQGTVRLNLGTAKPWQAPSKPAGYGLPCSGCRTYYTTDLTACPVCKNTERISAAAVSAPKTTADEVCPDPALLELERERFLREFNAQLLASKMQPLSANPRCTRSETHPSGSETAAVCQSCYDHLQERVDVLEAALHMDIKEAAQIVYDAVWADSSDSDKSYENAATALLSELRRRSGVTPTFGLMKPLAD
ncbi:MAG: hypothetical protein WB952_09570 [Terriglobales bacterium]